MIRLRAGKVQRQAPVPGRQLGEDQAALADLPPERAVRGGIGDIGAAAEHRDGAPRLERAAMRAGVDAEGEPADDEQPRGGQFAAELAGHLAAVGAGPPGADHGHRRLGSRPLEQRRVAAADQRPGRIGGVAQPGGKSRSAGSAQHPAAR